MRQPKPFFRKQTQTWYVQLNGRQINLGPNEKAAWAEYHKLMASRTKAIGAGSLAKVLDRYWRHIKVNLAKSTLDRRRPILKSFATFCGNLPANKLQPHHVLDWLAKSYKDASATYQHTLMTTIKAGTAWCAEVGLMDHDPLKGLRKPRPTVRQEFVPYERWDELLSYCGPPGDPFRLLVEFMLQTGCRAEEVFRIEHHHVALDKRQIILPITESKGRKRSRVIWLSDRAVDIVRLAGSRSPLGQSGLLFLNTRGNPWRKNSVSCRFRALKKKMQMPSLCATTLRHSFAHHRLTIGQDSHTVSRLMGHVDGRMLETRYGHLDANVQFMQEAANAG